MGLIRRTSMRASMSVWSSVRRPRRSTGNLQVPVGVSRYRQASSRGGSRLGVVARGNAEGLEGGRRRGFDDRGVAREDPRLVADGTQQRKVKRLAGIRSYDEILKASAHRIGSEFNIRILKEGGGKEGDSGERSRQTGAKAGKTENYRWSRGRRGADQRQTSTAAAEIRWRTGATSSTGVLSDHGRDQMPR